MKKGRTIQELVRSGELADVSHVALRMGVFCPAYVTRRFWDGELRRSEDLLEAVFDCSSEINTTLLPEGKTGQSRAVVQRGDFVGYHILIERFDGENLAVVLGDFDENFDIAVEETTPGDACLM
jgi:hypothetical protein